MELVQTPFQIGPVYSTPRSNKERQAIATEIQSLRVKGAVIEVSPQMDQFTSRLFVIPKKDGSQRPVINLRPLNSFIENHHFKMEGMSKVRELLRCNDWMCSVDLKDAYLSVPIAEQHRRFLRFVWDEITYEFTCLPFGLCSAPRVFTKLLRPVMAHLRFQGLRTVIYLDDMLIMAEDQERLAQQIQKSLTLLENLGFIINIPKSSLTPAHQITYLGLAIDSVAMKLCLTEEKLQQTILSCRELLTRTSVTVQHLSSVIGKLTATRLAVLPAPVYTRQLQQQLIMALRATGSFKSCLTLDQASRDELHWWIHQLRRWNGRMIMTPPPDMIILSDASLQGWGAVYNGTQTGGHWSMLRRNAT